MYKKNSFIHGKSMYYLDESHEIFLIQCQRSIKLHVDQSSYNNQLTTSTVMCSEIYNPKCFVYFNREKCFTFIGNISDFLTSSQHSNANNSLALKRPQKDIDLSSSGNT